MTSQIEFQECGICASKPGTPRLCPSCLHNRATIAALTKERDDPQAAEANHRILEVMSQTISKYIDDYESDVCHGHHTHMTGDLPAMAILHHLGQMCQLTATALTK